MKIVFASTNYHKCNQMNKLLQNHEVISISEYCDNFDVVENGDSYEENALIKARAAFKLCQMPVFADDSGINVAALDNGPGILSARFIGKNVSQELKNETIIKICHEKNIFDASFTCVIAYIDQNGQEYIFRYDLPGTIAQVARGNDGFGYNPIFIPENETLTMAEMDEDKMVALSHRGKAIALFLDFLAKKRQIHVVLYEPEIPQNTGNIMRTCAATGSKLHLIKPLGFQLDEARMRRSGMDYIDQLTYQVYENWEDFTKQNPSDNYYFLTRYGKKAPSEFNYPNDDIYFVLGKESTGIDKTILRNHLNNCMRLPMKPEARSLNLSNCAAIIVYEALRQNNYEDLSFTEVLKGENFLEESFNEE